jgi:Ca2+-binding EF-hand superfamily protein
VQRYWEGPEKARLAFEAADNDQDRRLSIAELADDSLLWVDTFNIFRRFDTDHSGGVDRRELNAQVKSWEQRYAQMAFPGFDADHNESLSFLEFRWTPLANPLADWNSRRTDEDHDGCLSLDEFCGREPAVPIGLAAMFMSRLDQDGDGHLSRAELDFFVDLPLVPVEAAFACLDADHNERLALVEAIPHDGHAPEDDAARRRHEEKVMRIEDLFRMADQDQSGDLSLAEFRNDETAVAAITGRQQSTSTTTDPPSGQTVMAASAGAAATESGTWNWRIVALVTLNLILVGSVAWFVLRS